MTILATELLEEGMVLRCEVKNPQGQVLFSKGMSLKEKHIDMMFAWGVSEVDIETNEDNGGTAVARLRALALQEEERIRPRFARCDMDDPVVAAVIRFCAERRVEKRSGER